MLMIDGEEQRRCPRRPILEEPEWYGNLFWLYRQFKAGYLVEVGALVDQPAKLMECFREVEVTMLKVDKFKKEQEELKLRRKNRAGAMSKAGRR